MTTEEIKQSVTMPEVVGRYGIEIRRDGMCSCPFHGRDKHPSMKVFKDGCHCFTCGAHEDIFSFIQRMDGCDFKTAFLSLGGTYERHSTKRERAVAKARIEAVKGKRQVEADIFQIGGRIFTELTDAIDWCKFIKQYHAPFGRAWCIAVETLPELDYLYDEIFCKGNKDISGIYILERCQKLRERLLLKG